MDKDNINRCYYCQCTTCAYKGGNFRDRGPEIQYDSSLYCLNCDHYSNYADDERIYRDEDDSYTDYMADDFNARQLRKKFRLL